MPRVGRAAFALGFAGLLPALAAACLIALGRPEATVVALLYPAVILSFLGGMWWGFAVRRTQNQGRLALVAVVPSLVAAGLVLAAVAGTFATVDRLPSGWISWPMVLLGVAILLTLPVDRHLVRSGDAPANWMRLRVPLSIGLGGLTIVSAVLLSPL
jgi:peptidoglycan/LPS O-acetylase OafA/YrhL